MDIFWTGHSPTQPAWSQQYMSIIFFHNDQQKRLALETRDREAKQRHTKIFAEIVPFAEFYLAETYHQKYRLQNDSQLMREFGVMHPEVKGFIDSTAAARVNGYLGGNGTLSALEADLAGLGLSKEAGDRLFGIVSGRNQ